MAAEIRWEQRFQNFQKALKKLNELVQIEVYSEIERDSLVKRFEFTLELAWKTLQDLLNFKGYIDVKGPKPVVKQAFKDGLIADDVGWILMLDARNMTSHIYDEEIALEIAREIKMNFFPLLNNLSILLEKECK